MPTFASRSATDYAAALEAMHARYDPMFGAGVVDALDRLSVFTIFRSPWFSAALVVLIISIVVCTLDRTPRLWRGVSDIRVDQPEPFFDPILPDRAAMDARPGRRRPAGPAPERLPGPRGDRRGRHTLPVRRPSPVHQDGDPVHPRRADRLPDRRRRDLAARRGAGAGRGRGCVPDRPADRHAGPAAGQEPGLPGARPGDRPGQRLHHRPGRLPRRPRDRPQDDPGQRPAVGGGLHVPPERVRSGAAPRPARRRRPGPVGRAGPDDRFGRRAAVRHARRPGPRSGSAARCSTARRMAVAW